MGKRCCGRGCCVISGSAEIEGSWIPLQHSQRHDAREELRRALDGILDLERLLSRVTLETANPRDVLALAASLLVFPSANVLAFGCAAPRRTACRDRRTRDLRQRIDGTLVPEPR